MVAIERLAQRGDAVARAADPNAEDKTD